MCQSVAGLNKKLMRAIREAEALEAQYEALLLTAFELEDNIANDGPSMGPKRGGGETRPVVRRFRSLFL